jgi:hypothetical protein
MALQLRRTTESFISTTTLAAGEPIFSTDTHKLFIGDGVTPGGFQIGAASTGTGTNPFDQNLYTTSSVTFAGLAVNSATIQDVYGVNAVFTNTVSVGAYQPSYSDADIQINKDGPGTAQITLRQTSNNTDGAKITFFDYYDGEFNLYHKNVPVGSPVQDEFFIYGNDDAGLRIGRNHDINFVINNSDGFDATLTPALSIVNTTSQAVFSIPVVGTTATFNNLFIGPYAVSTSTGTNPFDQNLYTTSSVSFRSLTLNDNGGSSQFAVYGDNGGRLTIRTLNTNSNERNRLQLDVASNIYSSANHQFYDPAYQNLILNLNTSYSVLATGQIYLQDLAGNPMMVLNTTTITVSAPIETTKTIKANRFSAKANNDQAGFSFYEIDDVTDPDTGMFSQAQGNLRFYSNGDLRVEITGTTVTVNADLKPLDNTWSLGTYDHEWANAWIASIQIGGVAIRDYTTSGINTTSSQYTIYSFNPAQYTGVKLLIKIADGSSLQMLEMLVISDGTDVLSTQYAVLNNNGLLGTISAVLQDSNVLIRFTTGATINSAVARVCATLMT